jgi:hypothetical protein
MAFHNKGDVLNTIKRMLLKISATLILSVMLSCTTNGVQSEEKPTVYGAVWQRGDFGSIMIRTYINRPEACLFQDVQVNRWKLDQGYHHGTYLISGSPLYLKPLSDYDLSIDFCGKIIEGTVQLPNNFNIISPANESTFQSGQDLEIQFSGGGKGFKFVVMVEKIYPEMLVTTHLSEPIQDTVYVIPSEAFSGNIVHMIKVFCFRNGILYENRILAADSNNLSPYARGFFGSWRMEFLHIYPEL